ncbi:hypothetical protein HKCCE2091_10900 [Rhodobacterales bacterium HKCCE2091]|nr:hypothetical protein [Rhodobacterales bacterium HKCCE2091]
MLRQDFKVLEVDSGDGIRIEIGASLIFLAFVMVHVVGGLEEFLLDALVFMVILLSLYLREAFRAAVALRMGLTVESVRLNGAGGSIVHSRATPLQAETLAAVGPLASLGLWALASLFHGVLPSGQLAHWVEIFAFVNLFIGIVTLLPVQPFDGGRFLLSALSRLVGPGFARRVMGALGLPLSVLWLPACLLAFLIFGMVLIALPTPREHWQMLTGRTAAEG